MGHGTKGGPNASAGPCLLSTLRGSNLVCNIVEESTLHTLFLTSYLMF